MSVLRSLPRAQPWNGFGYVCLACRHDLIQVSRSEIRRSHSTSKHTQSNQDDWATNFNNLSAELDSSKSRDAPSPTETAIARDGESEKSEDQRGSTGLKSSLGDRFDTIGREKSDNSKKRTPSQLKRAREKGQAPKKKQAQNPVQTSLNDAKQKNAVQTFFHRAGQKAEDNLFDDLVASLKKENEKKVSDMMKSAAAAEPVGPQSSKGPSSSSQQLSGFAHSPSELAEAQIAARANTVEEASKDGATTASTTSPGATVPVMLSSPKENPSSEPIGVRPESRDPPQEASSDVAKDAPSQDKSFMGQISKGIKNYVSQVFATVYGDHKAEKEEDPKLSTREQGAESPEFEKSPGKVGLSAENEGSVSKDGTTDKGEEIRISLVETETSDSAGLVRKLPSFGPLFRPLTVSDGDAASRKAVDGEVVDRQAVDAETTDMNLATESLAKLQSLQSTVSKKNSSGKAESEDAPKTSPEESKKEQNAEESPRKSAKEEKKLAKEERKLATEAKKAKEQKERKEKKEKAKELKERKEKTKEKKAKEKNAKEKKAKEEEAKEEKTEDSKPTEDEGQSKAISLDTKFASSNVASLQPENLNIVALNIPQPPVPAVQYGLERVLFNSGVYQLQDPHSRVYNFDPYLQKIMPVVEFDYNALKEYKTSSRDEALASLAKEHDKRYIGSTSSMTATLGHFHYFVSKFRPINLDMLSRSFPAKSANFTKINRAPNSIFLRWKDGTYAIDADKEFDGANVLMMLGKSMEKLLTLPQDDFERYRKSDPRPITDEERHAPESYEYTTMGDFLMRSQLDAHDSRLPGTGLFDLKTRAVISVRMDAADFQPMTGYEIQTLRGNFNSYEREYYDMIRSTMLKYSLQVRMGRMDGIFVAYHNVERIFGFQYISLSEMDHALHGQVDTCLGDQEFKISLEMMNKIFNKATEKFPEQSLRFVFETVQEKLGGEEEEEDTTVMWVYAEPMTEEAVDQIQDGSKAKVAEFERTMMGIEKKEEADTSVSDGAAATNSDSDTTTDDVTEPSSETYTEEFSSTKSCADNPWIEEAMPLQSKKAESPLFVASLVCRSRVNNHPVTRPENLRPDDKWEVDYVLEEWEADERMWARYAQAQYRRRDAFQERDDAENGDKKEDKYLTFLKSLSEQGRDRRGKIDKAEEDKEPVVLGQ